MHTKSKNLFSPSTACVAGCDFDAGDTCRWVTEQSDEISGFELYSGRGPTSGTGPHDDFSKPGREFSFFTSLKQNVSCSVLYFLIPFYLHPLSFSIYKVIKNTTKIIIKGFF